MRRFFLPQALCLLLLTSLHAQDTGAFDIPKTDEGLPGAGPIRRYDWFQKLWTRKRSAWAKEVDVKQGALVFFGDSITQGWGDNIGGAFDAKVANRGISGDTTRGMLLRLKEDVLSLKPSGVVMLMGTNDLEEGAEPAVIAENLKLIIAELKAANSEMPIVLCNVFPSHESKRRPAEKIKEINKLYAAAVKGDRKITVINTWAMFADENGNARKAEFPDLLHPNGTGYQMWGNTLRPVLETLDLVKVPADDFKPEPGYEMLFNGKDLTGWGYRQKKTLKKTDNFDGKIDSKEHRYLAKHGRLIVTTPPEGRAFTQLWTHAEFGSDFTLKLEFRANAEADSGVFIRKPQLQCRDYLVAGPYKELKKYKAGDWNEIVVEVKGRMAHCICNGEVLEAEFKLPPSGPIGLEGDRGQMEYRRIRLKKN
ncbi:MAG: GDSL-type esterase/lipase family protein [Akkermansiaceae bacterium]|nr:GDSL-type esterase/lipase family protein [Akkermansiaceae bacterium]